METIQDRINAIKKQSGLTQEQFGKKIGRSRQQIADILRGKSSLSCEDLIIISKEFNVSADYILGLTEVSAVDENIRAVCDFTGLSEKAVCFLQNAKEDEPFSSSILIQYIESFLKLFENGNNQDMIIDLLGLTEMSTVYYTVITDFLSFFEDRENEELPPKPLIDYDRIDDLGYMINGTKYKLSNFFNRFLDEFALSNVEGLTVEDMNKLVGEAKRINRVS